MISDEHESREKAVARNFMQELAKHRNTRHCNPKVKIRQTNLDESQEEYMQEEEHEEERVSRATAARPRRRATQIKKVDRRGARRKEHVGASGSVDIRSHARTRALQGQR